MAAERLSLRQTRGTPERPQRALQTALKGLERLGEREAHPAPLAEAQDELEEQVLEDPAGDGDAELVAVGEVEGAFSAGDMFLLEHHFLSRAVKSPPLVNTTLQSAQLTEAVSTAMTLAQLGEQRRGLELGALIGDENRNKLSVPDLVERVGTSPPRPLRFRVARERSALPCVRSAPLRSARSCQPLPRLP